MTFIKPQRQAAPWSDHHWWGLFDDAANLPNTATSDIQVASVELQRGDVAWADAPGAGSLYVCTDPTAGAAIWEPISFGGGASVQTRQDFYVDADNGNDSNPGTSAAPFATIQRAVAEIPDAVNADHYIHVREAPVAGTYAATGLGRIFNILNGSVIIVGEGVNVLYSGTIDGAPADQLTFTDAAQAWTDDELVGKSVRFLDGNGANHYRTIVENDGTTFTVADDIESNPGGGDAYEIFEPTVEIAFDDDTLMGGSATLSTSGSGAISQAFATLAPSPMRTVTYANLIISSSGAGSQLRQQGSQICILGCEIAAGSSLFEGNFVSGSKAYSGILTMPTDADDVLEDYGAGWGVFLSGRDGTVIPRFAAGCTAHGYVVTGGVALGASIGSSVGLCDLISGRICGLNGNAIPMASVFAGCSARIGGVVSTVRRATFICRPLASQSPTSLAAIAVYPGGGVTFGTEVVIDVVGTGGFGLYVIGGDVLFVDATAATEFICAADAGTFAIRVAANGTFLFDDIDLDQVTVGGANVAAVGVGPSTAIVTGDTGPGGDFTADGAFVQGSDGSLVMREVLF